MAKVDLTYEERDLIDDLVADAIEALKHGTVSYGPAAANVEVLEALESARKKLAEVASIYD